MSWTAPRTWVTDEVPTKAIMDQYIRDNQEYLEAGVRGFDSIVSVLDSQVDVSGVPQVSTSEDTALLTFDVPAGSLRADGAGIRVLATGRTIDNANEKKVRLCWGPFQGASVEQPLDTGNNITWGADFTIRAWVTRIASGLQYGVAWGLFGVTAPAVGYQSVDRCFGYQDEDEPIAVTLSGFSPDAASQVYGHSLVVELLRAPL